MYGDDPTIAKIMFNGKEREYVEKFFPKNIVDSIVFSNKYNVDRLNRRRSKNKLPYWDKDFVKKIREHVNKLDTDPHFVLDTYKGREFLVLLDDYRWEVIIKVLPTDVSGVELQSYGIGNLGLYPKLKESTYLKEYGDNGRDSAVLDEIAREITWGSSENPLSEHDLGSYFYNLDNNRVPNRKQFIAHYVEVAKEIIDDFDTIQKTNIVKRAKVFENLVKKTYDITKDLDSENISYHNEDRVYNDMNDFYKLKYTDQTTETITMNERLKEVMTTINPLISKIPLACQNSIMYETIGIVLRYVGYKALDSKDDLEILTYFEKLIKPSMEVKA